MMLLQRVHDDGTPYDENILITERQQAMDHYGIEDGSLVFVDTLDTDNHSYDAWMSNYDYSGAITRYFNVIHIHNDLTGE